MKFSNENNLFGRWNIEENWTKCTRLKAIFHVPEGRREIENQEKGYMGSTPGPCIVFYITGIKYRYPS